MRYNGNNLVKGAFDMTKQLSRCSVLRKWLISYLLILLTPFVSVIFSYNYAHGIVVSEVEASNRQTLFGVMTGVNDALSQLPYTAESLSRNGDFTDTLNAQKSLSRLRALLPDLRGVLNTYQRPFDDLELMVYLPGGDYLVTSSTANSRERLCDTVRIMQRQDVSGGFFPALDTPDYGGYFLFSGLYSYAKYATPRVVYIRSVRSGSLEENARFGTIIVNLSAERLLSRFGEIEDQVVLVFDDEGEYLFGAGADETLLSKLTCCRDGSGETLQYTIGDERYLGYQTVSPVNGWTFMLLSRESCFWQSTRHMTVMFSVMLAGALLVGLLLMVILLRTNYRPVRKTLSSIAPMQSLEGGDEFQMIQNSYSDLLDKHTDVRRKLAIHQEALLENYLFSHLHGSRESLPDAEMQSFLQLNLNGKFFAIISFMRIGDQQPAIDLRLAEAAGDQDAASFLIDSLFVRRFGDRYVGYRLPHDQLYSWLMVLEADQAGDFLDVAGDKLSDMLEQLSTALGVPFSALVSDVLGSFEALPNAYQDMQDFCTYQCAAGARGVVQVSSYKRRIARQDMRRREDEELELLCDAICARRPGDACDVGVRMIERLRAQAQGSGWVERMRLCGWVCLLLDTEEVMEQAATASVDKLLLSFSRADSLDDMGECFLKLIRLLGGDTQPREHGDGVRLSRRLQDYIDEHYTDPNLSLYHLGEVFGLTPKYLSRLYRSEADGSLLEYLNTVRVQAARRLLERGEETIEDIALQVGYTNAKTFRRAFLRIEGIAPSQAGDLEEDPADQELY